MAVISKALASKASPPSRPSFCACAAPGCGRWAQRPTNLSHRTHLTHPSRQRGVGLLSALLGLVIAAIITTGMIQGKLTEAQVNTGRLQADLLNQVKDAVNTYTMENYPALQSNLPVVKNGTTLAVGTNEGQSMAPTVADLVAMGYLSPNTSGTAYTGGAYRVLLRQEPTGCVDVACNIPGMVYIDRPITRPGSTETQGVTVGTLMNRVGGDVLVALNTNPTQLIAMNGANQANPVANTPEGVVGARVGFGASGFGQFLILNDPRDPNFQGALTVAGAIRSTTGSIGTGAGTSAANVACSLGEILNSGQIVSRTNTCIRRAFVDGSTGQVGAADATGTTRALLDGTTGHIASFDATGTQRSLMGFNGAGQSLISSDNLTNTAGTGGIDATGKVKGLSGDITTLTSQQATLANATLTALNNIGQACANEGGLSWAISGGRYVLTRCTANVWSSIGGLPTAATGTACSPNGAAAMSNAGAQLICSNGVWADLMDRMGRYALAASYLVQHGTTVPKPPCASGSTGSVLYLIPQNDTQAVQYVNRFATDNGGSWTVSIFTGTNQPLTNDSMVAQTYCTY